MVDTRIDHVAQAMLNASNDHYSIARAWDEMSDGEKHWWRGEAKKFLAAYDTARADNLPS